MFQFQARPPLPCHRRKCRRRQKSEQVSISGETTAPLPHTLYQEKRPGIVVSISGETTAPLPPPHLPGACRAACTFQSQARPPLPCHFVPPPDAILAHSVSISGETTAPLPRT